MKSIPELQDLLKKEIEQLRFGQHPQNLYEPISYIMSLGGKRLRPVLVLLAYQLRKQDPERVIRPALAVEVFHNFTLMHDDIMDDAPLRRGMPTVHEKWSETVAILSGDTMLVKAYDLLLELDPTLLPEAIRLFNKCATEVCEGQQIDMNFESERHVSVQQYLEMIRLKTAVLLGFSLEYGGLLAGISLDQRKLLYEIGENMGVGFQLMDDLLDVYADKNKFGKQVGGDIASNKKTYLLITALEKANPSQRALLESWLTKEMFEVEEKVAAVTAIYDHLGIRELTTQKMNDYFEKSFALMEKLEGPAESKALLIQFASSLMNRES